MLEGSLGKSDIASIQKIHGNKRVVNNMSAFIQRLCDLIESK